MAPGKASSHRRCKNTRKCILTGVEIGPGTPSLRFVMGPDGCLVGDLAAKLPGRGAWVTAGPGHLVAALERGAFKRAFKADISLRDGMVAEVFSDHLLALMRMAALRRLGLIRKSGGLITGFEKTREMAKAPLGKGAKIAAYLVAEDAGGDGREKIEKIFDARFSCPRLSEPSLGISGLRNRGGGDEYPKEPTIPVVDIFTREALCRATGEANLVHGVLIDQRAAHGFIGESQRIALFSAVTKCTP